MLVNVLWPKPCRNYSHALSNISLCWLISVPITSPDIEPNVGSCLADMGSCWPIKNKQPPENGHFYQGSATHTAPTFNIFLSSIVTKKSVFLKVFLPLWTGSCHGDDLLFLFSKRILDYCILRSDACKQVVENLTTVWTNFAKFG